MKSIKVTLLGKGYSIKVQPEDETMMYNIAEYVNQRFEEFSSELRGQPEATITALALLSIGEDLFIERRKAKTETVQVVDEQVGTRLKQLLHDIKLVNSDI